MEDSATEETANKFSTSWTFALNDDGDGHDCSFPQVPSEVIESFAKNGYVVFPNVLRRLLVEELNMHLEEVLRGRFDRSFKPDKMPKLLRNEYRQVAALSTTDNDKVSKEADIDKSSVKPETRSNTKSKKISYAAGPLGFSGNRNNVKVLQLINVHKADKVFRKLAVSPVLGYVVAQLAGWRVGTRLAQDQVWAKPPGAPPLTFHRDSPYFMFDNAHVITVWVALDDMDDEAVGPLQYVKGSHKWGDGRVGSANQFFDAHGGTHLVESAAERAGQLGPLQIESLVGLMAGGISIHDGRTWHGSGPNLSKNRPRRGLGLHFVPANVRFTEEAAKSRLWRKYLEESSVPPHAIELPEEDFPITWMPMERVADQ